MNPIGIVTTAWLADHLGDPTVVVLDGSYYLPSQGRDARAEFLAAHVPGARRFDVDAVSDRTSDLPHMLPDAATFAAAAGALGIGRDTLVVAYDGLGLFSAARVAWTFRAFGSERVAILDGGFPAWRAEGRPTEGGEPAPASPVRYEARLDPGAVATYEDVRRALETGEAQLVDARSASRFTGAEAETRPGLRSGHMPGALNLHYGSLLRDGRLADPATLAATIRAAGIDPERPVVATCGSGVTAAIVVLALERIGHPARALYDGSWAEWGGRPDAPVATG